MSAPRPTEPVNLATLRRSRRVTQTRLCAPLGVSQSEVSRIERHTNVLVATVHAYVLAMGGELELAVSFPGDGERERIVLDLP